MTLQAWQTHFWEVSPIILCRTSQPPSGWKGSLSEQQFSDLSTDVQLDSSVASGPLEDIHKVVLKPLLCHLGCVLRVRKVLLSPQSNTGALSKSPLGSSRFLVTSPALYPNQSDRPGSRLWEEFLVVPFPFTDDGGHCIHWDLQCCRRFFSTVSQIYVSIQFSLRGLQTWTSCNFISCQIWKLSTFDFALQSSHMTHLISV